MNKLLKTPPPYAIASVDHALRVAVMLQLEDGLTVSEVAERLGVARSTAHRLLAMLVYRDFAVQDENQALEQLDALYAKWSAAVRRLGDEGLTDPSEFADEPMSTVVLHINREIIHHGAEIALLRDLYRAKQEFRQRTSAES